MLDIKLVLSGIDGQKNEWVACADKNDSPEYDASGETPLIAMTKLAELLFKELEASLESPTGH